MPQGHVRSRPRPDLPAAQLSPRRLNVGYHPALYMCDTQPFAFRLLCIFFIFCRSPFPRCLGMRVTVIPRSPFELDALLAVWQGGPWGIWIIDCEVTSDRSTVVGNAAAVQLAVIAGRSPPRRLTAWPYP